jgi:hypothetical protein
VTVRELVPALAVSVLIALSGCARADSVHDPANELPFGNVDVPVEGARVPATTSVAGWAVDDRGIREIRIYVDGRYAGLGWLNGDRPDVAKLFPQYVRRGEPNGWVAAASFDQPGSHTILVQALDSDGAARDIGVVHVTAVDR